MLCAVNYAKWEKNNKIYFLYVKEYKRRSGKLDPNDSPSDRHYLGASSGSLSSSVSLSSSTDCIEEYQGGDVPFAGKFTLIN